VANPFLRSHFFLVEKTYLMLAVLVKERMTDFVCDRKPSSSLRNPRLQSHNEALVRWRQFCIPSGGHRRMLDYFESLPLRYGFDINRNGT
jgi:hypothetical protein